jgi:hypothetical protein
MPPAPHSDPISALKKQLEDEEGERRLRLPQMLDRAICYSREACRAELGREPSDDEFYGRWATLFKEVGKELYAANLFHRIEEFRAGECSFEQKLAGAWLLCACNPIRPLATMRSMLQQHERHHRQIRICLLRFAKEVTSVETRRGPAVHPEPPTSPTPELPTPVHVECPTEVEEGTEPGASAASPGHLLEGSAITAPALAPGRAKDSVPEPAGQVGKGAADETPATSPTEATASEARAVVARFVFAPSGNGYDLRGFGEAGHLSNLKGLHVVYQLIQTPGGAVSMLDLAGADDRLRADRRTRQDVLDPDAKRDIVEELNDLHADLERARARNNTVEADLAEKAIEQLTQHLLQAAGLGGKSRDLNNPFDQLRPRIHGQLKTVYQAMRDSNPPMSRLAEHFESSITSEGGSTFVYRPARTRPPWQFQFSPQK